MIIIKELCDLLSANIIAGREYSNQKVDVFYTSDITAEIISNAPVGSGWITSLKEKNIIAAASVKDFKAIIITGGNFPDNDTLKYAENEKIPLLITMFNNFECSGLIYQYNKQK